MAMAAANGRGDVIWNLQAPAMAQPSIWNYPKRKEARKVSAFQKVYETYAQPVYRFLLTLAGNEDLAEELLQETFYQAFQHIDRFEGRCSLYTWLCQIGKNAWIKECRRNRRYSEIGLEDLPLLSASPEEQAIAKDEYCRIHKAIQNLEAPYRDVFIMHALGGVKLKEVALIYDKSESWARVSFYRAKQKIALEVLK